MLDVHDLPALNAGLNSLSTVLLITGWFLIRNRKIAAHRAVMITALVTSSLFLTSYLIYHAQVGSVPFQGQGPIRKVYFAILISHTVLAAFVAPLALVTVYRAFGEQFERHKALARWTFPIWLYVSVTGVVIYFMLY